MCSNWTSWSSRRAESWEFTSFWRLKLKAWSWVTKCVVMWISLSFPSGWTRSCVYLYIAFLPGCSIELEQLTQTHILFSRMVTFINNVLRDRSSMIFGIWVEQTYLLNISHTHFNAIGIFKIGLLSEVDIFGIQACQTSDNNVGVSRPHSLS